MFSRELKHFHNENRTHVTKKEYAGAEISVGKTPVGKNLLHSSATISKISGVTMTYDNGVITLNGTCTISAMFELNKIVLSAGTYTLSANANKVPVNNHYTFVQLYDRTNNIIIEIPNSNAQGYQTSTTYVDGNFAYRVRIHSGCVYDNVILKPQLEEGSTATEYEPFIPETYPVNAPMDLKIYGASEQTADYVMCEGGSAQVVTDEPASPSAEYPSEITPLVAAGTYKVVLSDGVYELTIPDMYSVGDASDKVMIDKVSKSGRLKKEIDVSLLDFAKTIAENTQAILRTPTYTDITLIKVSSASAPHLPLTAYGKNLFPICNTSIFPYTMYGVTFEYDENEQIYTLNGTADIDFQVILDNGNIYLSNGKTYTLSWHKISGDCSPLSSMSVFINRWGRGDISLYQLPLYFASKSKTVTLTEDIACSSQTFWILSGATFTDFKFRVQLECNDTYTDYEPFNATPPESFFPSKAFPHYIYSTREMQIKSVGTQTVSTKIPIVGNAMEVSNIAQSNLVLDGKYYLSDYIEYDSATDKAYRHKFIDDTLFNTTLPIKDQTQAILAKPTVEEITAGNGEYSFKDAKSVQDGFALTTESYSTDGLPHPKPMYIEAKIKVIKG